MTDTFGRIFQNREVPQPEEIHFEKTEFFQSSHRILTDDRFVVLRERDIVHHRPFRNHDSRGMSGCMPGHAFQSFCNVDQLTDTLVALRHIPQRFGDTQRLLQGHVDRHGDLLRHDVRFSKAHRENTADITDGSARSQGTEGNDLRNVIFSVDPVHIVDDLTPAVDTEVHIDIRHGYAFGIQESFKEKAVFDRVDVGDVKAVGNHASRRASAPGTDRDPLAFGIRDEIRDD